MTMYNHGGNPQYDFERLGIKPVPVIDFSVNISPLGVPKAVKELWPKLLNENLQYPTTNGAGVKQFYESRFDLSPDCVLAGNGSIDLIYDIPRILNIKQALIPQPSFHDYTRACNSIGAKVIDGQLDQLEGCDAHFIGNPNNPTGKLIPAEILLQLSENFPEVMFLIDEAFIQFIEDADDISLLHPDRLRDNIIVFHSLTKTYALPGLRIGACISTPKTISFLESRRAPWMVSRIAERVAETLSSCAAYEEEVLELTALERIRIFHALNDHDSFTVTPGAANFLLAQWKGSDNLDDLLKYLLSNSCYVRDCRNVPKLGNNWFRIGMRTREENDFLLKAIDSL